MYSDFSNRVVPDNIGGQRSKFELITTILHICLEGSLKNHIIGKGNFSDAMVNHYLSILLYHNLLVSERDINNRVLYKTTEKGRQFLSLYKEIQDLFERPRGSIELNKPSNLEQPKITSQKMSANGNVRRILVVDDEFDITSALRIGLEDNGFEVDVFNDPIIALSSYKPRTYDLLLIDVRMPKMNGFELFKEIQKIDPIARVCFWTAYESYSKEFKDIFPSMNDVNFVQKPIPMPDLIKRIQSLTQSV